MFSDECYCDIGPGIRLQLRENVAPLYSVLSLRYMLQEKSPILMTISAELTEQIGNMLRQFNRQNNTDKKQQILLALKDCLMTNQLTNIVTAIQGGEDLQIRFPKGPGFVA
jgi:hypothetical protein